MKRLAILVLAFVLAGCALFSRATRPAAFGAEITACQQQAPEGPAGWAVYTPCCLDVARRYARSTAQCFPPDGGAP